MHYIPNEKQFQLNFNFEGNRGKKRQVLLKWGLISAPLVHGAHGGSPGAAMPGKVWHPWVCSASRALPRAAAGLGQSREIHQGPPQHEGCKTRCSHSSAVPASQEDSYFRRQKPSSHAHPKAALHFTSVSSPPMHININFFSSPIPIMIYLQRIYCDTPAEGNAYKPHSCCTRINF